MANLNGALWHDVNYNNAFDSGELLLEGWSVEVFRSGQLLGTFVTDSSGQFTVQLTSPVSVTVDLDGVHCDEVAGTGQPIVTRTLQSGHRHQSDELQSCHATLLHQYYIRQAHCSWCGEQLLPPFQGSISRG